MKEARRISLFGSLAKKEKESPKNVKSSMKFIRIDPHDKKDISSEHDRLIDRKTGKEDIQLRPPEKETLEKSETPKSTKLQILDHKLKSGRNIDVPAKQPAKLFFNSSRNMPIPNQTTQASPCAEESPSKFRKTSLNHSLNDSPHSFEDELCSSPLKRMHDLIMREEKLEQDKLEKSMNLLNTQSTSLKKPGSLFTRSSERKVTSLNELMRMPTRDIRPEEKFQWLLRQDSPILRTIFTIEMIVLIYILSVVPMKLSFYLHDPIWPIILICDKICKVFLSIDLLLKFFTPVYINHEPELSHRMIAKSIVSSPLFYLDIYSIIPWQEIFFDWFCWPSSLTLITIVNLSFLAAIVGFVLPSTSSLRSYLTTGTRKVAGTIFGRSFESRVEREVAMPLTAAIHVYLPAMFFLIAVCHFYACIFYYCGTNYAGIVEWQTLERKQDMPVLDKYTASVYFVVQTVSSLIT